MSKDLGVEGSGAGYYGVMNGDDYAQKINTPAGSQAYYDQFHAPMVERARSRLDGTPITLLDIACGPGKELDFFPDDVRFIATDISPDILPEVRERTAGEALVFAADAEHSPIRAGVADVGILVNAMIYSPGSMMAAMTDALKVDGELAVNFRDFSNPHNRAFYDYYTDRGGVLLERSVTVGKIGVGASQLDVAVLDYTECVDDTGAPDEAIRPLGQQMYFTSPGDIARVATSTGLEVVTLDLFNFSSPVNPDNQVDVFVLKKVA